MARAVYNTSFMRTYDRTRYSRHDLFQSCTVAYLLPSPELIFLAGGRINGEQLKDAHLTFQPRSILNTLDFYFRPPRNNKVQNSVIKRLKTILFSPGLYSLIYGT